MTTSTLIENTAVTFAPGSLVESAYSGNIILVTDSKQGERFFSGTVLYGPGTEPSALIGHYSEGWGKSCFRPATKGVQLTP